MPSEEFIQFRARMRIPNAPVWGAAADSTDGLQGVREILAGWIMRYIPSLETVLLAFDEKIRLLEPTQEFLLEDVPFVPLSEENVVTEKDKEDEDVEVTKVKLQSMPTVDASGFSVAFVEFSGVGWQPRVGDKVYATPALSTPSHFSLLVHNLFNATIPLSHIPQEKYIYNADLPIDEAVQERRRKAFAGLELLKERLVKETVPEIEKPKIHKQEEEKENEDEGNEDEDKKEVDEEEDEEEEDEDDEEEEDTEKGWWVDSETGEPLGGNGRVEFTIIGITVVNSMISITGSLLPDPFATQE